MHIIRAYVDEELVNHQDILPGHGEKQTPQDYSNN
jgi:hypothetical protein